MKVYNSIPAANVMAARCKRDNIVAAELVEVVAPKGGYAIRCLGLPVKTGDQVTGFILYSERGNGTVFNGFGFTHAASKMLEIAGVAQ